SRELRVVRVELKLGARRGPLRWSWRGAGPGAEVLWWLALLGTGDAVRVGALVQG
ncbi:unnamed protein product, partial [Effrenium voratum]